MTDKFMRWAILTALKLLYIIAVPSHKHWSAHDLRKQIEDQEES